MTQDEMVQDLRKKIDEYHAQCEKKRGENTYALGVYSGMLSMAEYVIEELTKDDPRS